MMTATPPREIAIAVAILMVSLPLEACRKGSNSSDDEPAKPTELSAGCLEVVELLDQNEWLGLVNLGGLAEECPELAPSDACREAIQALSDGRLAPEDTSRVLASGCLGLCPGLGQEMERASPTTWPTLAREKCASYRGSDLLSEAEYAALIPALDTDGPPPHGDQGAASQRLHLQSSHLLLWIAIEGFYDRAEQLDSETRATLRGILRRVFDPWTVTFQYDERDYRIGQETDDDGDGVADRRERYLYDDAGDRLATELDFEADGTFDRRCPHDPPCPLEQWRDGWCPYDDLACEDLASE
jgi:hypothetical protein